MDTKGKTNFTKIIMNADFKSFCVDIIRKTGCHDPSTLYFINNQSSYEPFHKMLQDYFVQHNYLLAPSQPDNFAFLCMLTYLPEQIQTFTSWADIKLCIHQYQTNHWLSDFEYRDTKHHDDGGPTDYTCICNKSIQNVHPCKNIKSGLIVNIGCECIKKYKVCNYKDERFKKVDKAIREHTKERKEGKPIGFYQREREMLKERKHATFLAQNPDTNRIRICLCCQADFCQTMENNETKFICSKKKCQQQHKSHLENLIRLISCCAYCEKDKWVINKNKETNILCYECKKDVKMVNCLMCNVCVMVEKTSRDNYCPECETKVTKCNDCDTIIYKDIRCPHCSSLHKRGLMEKKCHYCSTLVEVSNQQSTSRKECCVPCFHLNKIKANCKSCDWSFNRLPHETWKNKCPTCYRYFMKIKIKK